jgi:hypothetical protein
VVHPASLCGKWNPGAAGLTAGAMSAAPPPNKRMAMRVPVSAGLLDGSGHLGPGLKAAAFERQHPQRLPPGFDQVEVSGIGGLEHKMPARVGQREQQHVGGPVRGEVVDDGKGLLGLGSYPLIDRLEEIDPVSRGAPWVGQRKSPTVPGFEGAENVALAAPAVINCLPGAAGGLPRAGGGS